MLTPKLGVDSKYLTMERPKHIVSLYYNYKGFYSLVLLAICDADYYFKHVDISHSGRRNNSGGLRNSQMEKGFENDTFNIHLPSKIPGIEEDLLFFLVGEEIFPLKSWLQRPFPGPLPDESKKIFNHRS